MYLAAALTLLVAVTAFWLWTPDRDLKSLEASHLRSAADRIDVGGQPLHLRDDGPRGAPAVILLHGLGASLHTWEPWARELASEFRVIRFDLPGSGLSPPDLAGDYSDARSLRLLLALMDQLGLQRASLVGNSVGGRLAWSFAARYPERVDKLVLVSPDGFASPGFEYGKAPEVPAVLGLMRVALPKAVLRMNLAPAYADPSALSEALLERYHDLLLAPGARQAMLQRMRQTVLQDPVPLLRQIQAPTLLLWGEQDAMIPVANAADYLNALPRATLVRLPALGHVPQEEDPVHSLAPLRAFLRG